MANIVETTDFIKLATIEQLRDAFGDKFDALVERLALVIARHAMLREIINKRDKLNYERATKALADEFRAIPNVVVEKNLSGWATKLYIIKPGARYYIHIGKPIWETIARYWLETIQLDDGTKVDADVGENIADPDNEEYEDEIVIEEKANVDEEGLSNDELVETIDPPSVAVVEELDDERDEERDVNDDSDEETPIESESENFDFDWDELFATRRLTSGQAKTTRDLLACINELDDNLPIYLAVGGKLERLYASDDPCWTSGDVCYLNDATVPIGLNRELGTVGELIAELRKHEPDEDVYCFDALLTFAGMSNCAVTKLARHELWGDGPEGEKVVFRLIDPANC